MAGSSIFVTYGIKGGAAQTFLRRERTAFGQLQTRTRTSSASFQRQNRGCIARQQNTCIQWTGWSNVTTCANGFFNGGYTSPQCRNLMTSCNFASFTDGNDTGGCTAVSPACDGNNRVIRQCRTDFRFREQDGSSYTEVDECTPSTPTVADGAVQVECVPN